LISSLLSSGILLAALNKSTMFLEWNHNGGSFFTLHEIKLKEINQALLGNFHAIICKQAQNAISS
jgi:hypothetical protein